MTTITLESIEAKQSELADMIAAFKSSGHTIAIPAMTITLRPGERYAGLALDDEGLPTHHLILLPQRPDGDLNWQAAMDWAASVGGVLPTRQEQPLLFAHCKPHLKPRWHWSSETHEDDASYAWYCTFISGYQNGNHKSYEACAVAVRRPQLVRPAGAGLPRLPAPQAQQRQHAGIRGPGRAPPF